MNGTKAEKASFEPEQKHLDSTEQIRRFKSFLEENYYAPLLEAVRKGKRSIAIDFGLLTKFDPELSDEILEHPEETIKACEIAAQDFDFSENVKTFRIRFDNIPASQTMLIREIRSEHIGKFLHIEGVVRQKSDVRPQVTTARFECPSCGNVISVIQLDTKFKEPTRCGCGRKGKFLILDKDLVDAQGIVLEEASENLDGGEQPKRMNVFLKEDLVSPLSDKKTNPGTKIVVNGFVKEVPITLNTGGTSTRFELLIEANFVDSSNEEFADIEITNEEKEEILEMSTNPKIKEMLIQSVAPSIFGHNRIKEALLYQMMGGIKKERKDGVVTRGDMHILLIGDPGSGKSQLLKRMSKIAPKARFVSGKGASGAGLTAAVVKDEFLKGWSLEAGALVLANKGICVTGDTDIILKNNKITKIENIYTNFLNNKKTEVMSFNDQTYKSEPTEVINVSKRIPKELLEIEFNTGQKLKITPEHPVPKWDNGIKWTPIGEIKKGDYLINTNDYSTIETNNTYSDKFLELAGMIATDGHLSLKKNNIKYYTKDYELYARFTNIIIDEFGIVPNSHTDKKNGVVQIYFSSKKIKDLLVNLGIPKGNKSKSGFNLDKIYNLSKREVKSFLTGAINGEGSISNRKSGGVIDLICGNKTSAESFQKLFYKLGIISRVNEYIGKGESVVKKGSYKLFKTSITGVENISKLNDDRLITNKFISINKISKRNNLSNLIPNIDKILKEISISLPHGKKALLYKNSIRTFTNQFNKKTLLNIKHKSEKIQKITNKNIFFSKITKIRKITSEPVYNIQVKSNFEPTYFANFIPVHNCMIDELDKMSEEDRSAMHEALEGQTITISKANIQATLRSETTVLAAANPKFGRFDPYEPIAKQIDLPPALMNRFDLIFPIRDLPDKDKDEKMASFILNLHKDPTGEEPEISTRLIRKYIAYTKRYSQPELTDGAIEEIKRYYIKMRLKGQTEGEIKSIPISARQLEALVRLAEGCSKLRLGKEVSRKDAKEAIDLLHYSMLQIGVDPETGEIDMDRIATGISSSERNKIVSIKEIINDLEKRLGRTIPLDEIMQAASEKGMKEEKVEEAIDKLKKTGDIFEPRRGFISKI